MNLLQLLIVLLAKSYYSIPISINDIRRNCEFDRGNVKSTNISAYVKVSSLCLIYKFNVSKFEFLINNIDNYSNCQYEHKHKLQNINWNVSTSSEWDMRNNCLTIYVNTNEMTELERLSGSFEHICNSIDVIFRLMFKINKKFNLFSKRPISYFHLFMPLEDLINDITNESDKMDKTHMLPLSYFRSNASTLLHISNSQYQYKHGMINVKIGFPIFEKNPMNVYSTNDGYYLLCNDFFQPICYDETDFTKKCSKLIGFNDKYLCERIKHMKDYKNFLSYDKLIILLFFLSVISIVITFNYLKIVFENRLNLF